MVVEVKLVDQVVNLFCDKVLMIIKLFGYMSYMICDVYVSEGSNNLGLCLMMCMVVVLVLFDLVLVFIEGGKVQVMVIVFGVVQMLK